LLCAEIPEGEPITGLASVGTSLVEFSEPKEDDMELLGAWLECKKELKLEPVVRPDELSDIVGLASWATRETV
jgi:hypothetical protein